MESPTFIAIILFFGFLAWLYIEQKEAENKKLRAELKRKQESEYRQWLEDRRKSLESDLATLLDDLSMVPPLEDFELEELIEEIETSETVIEADRKELLKLAHKLEIAK